MTTFEPAVREDVRTIIGLVGGTGSGKTYSALRLATGLAGGKRFAAIDTENGRMSLYADEFAFDVAKLEPPFRPERYAELIAAAEAQGYPVIVVDSASHEHAGEGGLLDWHDEILDEIVERKRGGGSEWQIREANNMRAWIEPKKSHKALVGKLLRLKAHLIICLRAENKVKMVKEGGKTKIVDAGWQPICAKGLEFEMTASFLLSHESPGLPNNPLKLPRNLQQFFPRGSPIGEDAGKGLAKWASGRIDSVSLPDVLEAISSASTADELKAAAGLAAGLHESDKGAARDAYKARQKDL